MLTKLEKDVKVLLDIMEEYGLTESLYYKFWKNEGKFAAWYLEQDLKEFIRVNSDKYPRVIEHLKYMIGQRNLYGHKEYGSV